MAPPLVPAPGWTLSRWEKLTPIQRRIVRSRQLSPTDKVPKQYTNAPKNKHHVVTFDDIDETMWRALTRDERKLQIRARNWLLDHHVPHHQKWTKQLYSVRARRFGRLGRGEHLCGPRSACPLDIDPDVWKNMTGEQRKRAKYQLKLETTSVFLPMHDADEAGFAIEGDHVVSERVRA